MLLSLLSIASLMGGATGDDLEVQVVDPDGAVAVGVEVEAHVGLVHYALSEDFDRWIAFERHTGKTDETGRARFEDLPAGAQLTVFARAEGLAGLSDLAATSDWGSVACRLQLQPTGSVRGKVSAKKVQLRYYELAVVGPRGLVRQELALDSKGKFEVADVPAGDIELRVELGGWLAARAAVEVEPDKRAKAPALKVTEEFLTGADPLVDVARIQLVDEEGEPMEGTSFTWVGPQMFGRMIADAEGEVLLAGGNVAIGPPPFVLRLGLIGVDQDERYVGRLTQVKRGTARVEVVARLRKLRVSVRRNEKYLRSFKVFAVTGKDEPRVWEGRPSEGDYELFVPPGDVRLVVGLPDGTLHVVEYELTESVEPADTTLDL